MIIKKVRAREIKDSRGEKTIEVEVNGIWASSPSGKSTGAYESRPYRKSLKWNINFLKNWDAEIEILNFWDLRKVEFFIKKKLGLRDVKEFGANALFAFESAILKALAKEQRSELWEIVNPFAENFPRSVGNVIGGGLHSSKFKIHPDFQEFLVIPDGKSFEEDVKVMNFVHLEMGKSLKTRKKNDEGGWQTAKRDEEILEIFNRVRKKAERKFKVGVDIGLDVAASSFYSKKRYKYRDVLFKRSEQIFTVWRIAKKYNLFYLEDPLDERDFKGFKVLKKELRCLVVGDDLTATQISRLNRAIRKKAINAMIIKPNQNGSLLEVAQVFRMCRRAGIKTIMSHRSGETEDDALADYAFGFGADFIKTGIKTRWRERKLKRMIKIEKEFKKRLSNRLTK